MKLLSRNEEIVLLAIWRLKDNAYGVTIRKQVSEVTDIDWSFGQIYVPLDIMSFPVLTVFLLYSWRVMLWCHHIHHGLIS